jgi:fumarate hydratase class II
MFDQEFSGYVRQLDQSIKRIEAGFIVFFFFFFLVVI